MNNKYRSIILIFVAASFAACEGTAGNKPVVNTATSQANANAANSNTTAKSAPPTKEVLVAIEKKAWENWAARNESGLEGYMASKFVNVGSNGSSDRAAAMKSWTNHKCEMKDLAFSDEAVTELAEGVALMTFKATSTMTCDGDVGPSPLNVSVVYAREGDAWKAMYYQEVPAVGAKGEYGPPSASANKDAELAGMQAAPEDIVTVEKKLWDTWKAQDRKGFEEHLSENIIVNGATGRLDKAKYMTAAFDSECKVDSVSLGPMKSMEISKDLTMVFYRAAVKAACGKDTLPPNSMATTIYKRENGVPKAIYFMENPVRN